MLICILAGIYTLPIKKAKKGRGTVTIKCVPQAHFTYKKTRPIFLPFLKQKPTPYDLNITYF